MIAAIFLVLLAVGYVKADCSTVDCSSYKFKVTPNDNGFAECRFKLRHDSKDLSNKFLSGFQVHGHADLAKKDSGEQKPTQDCPTTGKVRMTDSPRKSDNVAWPGDDNYKTCCVPKVLNFCHYKVHAIFNCNKWSPVPGQYPQNDREDDVIKRVEVVYTNKAAKKTVTVKFFPKLAKVTCENDFGRKTQTLYKGKGKKAGKFCGDRDINVKLMRYTAKDANGNDYIMLKVQRYQCNSQYAAMFTDPSNREKFTIRTVVDPAKSRKVGGALIAPVLAHTVSGECGAIAKSVEAD